MEKKRIVYLDCLENERELYETELKSICKNRIVLTDHVQEAHVLLCIKNEGELIQQHSTELEAKHYGIETVSVTKTSIKNPIIRQKLQKKIMELHERKRDREYSR